MPPGFLRSGFFDFPGKCGVEFFFGDGSRVAVFFVQYCQQFIPIAGNPQNVFIIQAAPVMRQLMLQQLPASIGKISRNRRFQDFCAPWLVAFFGRAVMFGHDGRQ